MPEERLIRIDQAAELLKVHINTVRNYIKRGELQALKKVGTRALFVERQAIEALKQPRPVNR